MNPYQNNCLESTHLTPFLLKTVICLYKTINEWNNCWQQPYTFRPRLFWPHAAWWSALLYGREHNTESSAPLSWNMPMRNTPSSVQSNDLKLLELHQTTHKQQQCRCWSLTDPASIDRTCGYAIGTVELHFKSPHGSWLILSRCFAWCGAAWCKDKQWHAVMTLNEKWHQEPGVWLTA